MCRKLMFLASFIMALSLSAGAQAAVVSFHAEAPTPGPYDVYNLVGAARDANNVGTATQDGPNNDPTTYVSYDRGAMGQTFVTGGSEPVYLLTGIWVRHVGYTTENTVTTWYTMQTGQQLGIRLTDPCAPGTAGFVLNSETYTITGSEPNKLPAALTNTLTGTGTWIHIVFDTPTAVAPNKIYGFDVLGVRIGGGGLFFETHGIKDTAPGGNPYTAGSAYTSGLNGAATNTLTVAPGDRVFVVELVGAPPASASVPYPANNKTGVETDLVLSWNAGYESTESKVYFGSSPDSLVLQTSIAHTEGVDRYSYPVTGLAYNQVYYWRVDQVPQTGSNVTGDFWSFTTGTTKASNPNPYDNEICVSIDPVTTLSWNPGLDSTQSKVYFGTSPGSLLLQTTITHTQGVDNYSYPVTGLANDQDYYWRVDQVSDSNTMTGDVWNFKTIPVITVSDPNLVGWWKFDEGPGKAIDWSGLNQHGTAYGNPVSVAGYDGYAMGFDGVDDRVQLPIGSTIASLNSTTIATWVNFSYTGDNWHRVFDFGNDPGTDAPTVYMFLTPYNDIGVPEFGITTTGTDGESQVVAPSALPTGWHHMAVTIDGSSSQMILYIDAAPVVTGDTTTLPSDLGDTNDNWLSQSKTWMPPDPYFIGSLDDFRIYDRALMQEEVDVVMKIDPLRARNPIPEHGQTLIIEDFTILSWLPGDDATQHDVYFGTDRLAVENADTSTTDIYCGQQAGTSFSPSEGVEWGQKYYWRIDEVNNDGSISKGNTWTFNITDYLIVDDFEDYNDYPPDEVWNTWLDGYDDPTNGSSAGYPDPDFVLGEHYLEDVNVHGGDWSMPLFYDNSVGISEVTRTFTSTMRDWTRQDVAILTLFYYGDPANAAEPMFVALNGDALVTNDDADAALLPEWIRWDILLQEFADQGVNLSNVGSMTIGFGNKANPVAGGEGHVFFDDIRLYRP